MNPHPEHLLYWLAAGFAATVVVTAPVVRWLVDMQFGKTIRAELGELLMPPAHAEKSGTPTMGGLAMLGVVLVAGLLLLPARPVEIGLILAVTAGFALLGLADDLAGLGRLPSLGARDEEKGIGLSARWMFGLQIGIAALGGAVAVATTGSIAGGWPPVAVVALFVLVVVGTVNGVNLSDGLDGLAGGLLALAFAALSVVSWAVTGPNVPALLGFATAGACLGFLVYNRHPARVFMGGVGSLGLGALLAMIALATHTWLLLPVVGAVFVAEVVSVVLQVVWFKATGGQRLFRMAPLHHHFEMQGWDETTVVRHFWTAGAAAAVAGLLLAGLVRL